MSQKIEGAQRDFSYGEIDVALKRADEHPARKGGLRQMLNMRILNSGSVQNRSGRTALFPCPGVERVEEVVMSAGNLFKILFGSNLGTGSISILNSVGTAVAVFFNQGNGALLPWTAATVGQIVYCQVDMSIYLTFAGMRPQVITWDGASAWSIEDYAELVVGTGQKRTLFYRISPQGITLQPSAQTGSGVSLTASSPVFTPARVGTRMRFVGRQMLITGYSNPSLATVTVEETLPGSQTLAFGLDPTGTFSVGDVVFGTTTGANGVVTAVSAGSADIAVQLLNNTTTIQASTGAVVAFTNNETCVGQSGSLLITGVSVIGAPQPCTDWDDEVINSLQGYPASCFFDQFRLGFTDFPTVPGGIAWSAIDNPGDLYVVGASQPSGAIFELAPDKVQVLYVVPGPESSEFVFCDKKIYYIKIDSSNPLVPGSVSFATLTSDGAAQVQPRATQEVILYVNAGRNSVMAVMAPGAYYRPFNTTNLCDFHSHLFNNITCIAAPTADGTFNERYAYVLNGDGTIAVGKYSLKDGQVAGAIGWGPMSGAAVVSWISAFAADVLFTSAYYGNFTVCEILDDSRYLDCSVLVNSVPPGMAPANGRGPLWWAATQSVSLMDQVTRSMGTYQVDANGFIVPQNNGGENLAVPTLIAGLPWTSITEPFVPDANPGGDVHQRMFKRRVSRFAAYVIHATGFTMARLFSGPLTRTSPPLGTIMNFRRFPAYNQDDDATLPPPQRETTERIRPLGRAFDPRVAIIKDTPGPMTVVELGMEATV